MNRGKRIHMRRSTGKSSIFLVFILATTFSPSSAFLPPDGSQLQYPTFLDNPRDVPGSLLLQKDSNNTPQNPSVPHTTKQCSFDLSKNMPLPRKARRKKKTDSKTQRLSFQYNSTLLALKGKGPTTTGIVLIHPIGVGIGKWFHNRLMESLYEEYQQDSTNKRGLLVVAPDLLGSGTACNPLQSKEEVKKLPLLRVQDWSSQLSALMANLEQDYPQIEKWCLVANGGCSPIALEVPKQAIQNHVQQQKQQSDCFQRPVTNVILSSVPRLPFFLPLDDSLENQTAKLQKLEKSYKTLSGIVGRLFWWYSLRKEGKFIQKFSERNLVANAANLGPDWTPNCVATAWMCKGKSRYSTFAFLAGSLQVDGCRDSLATLKGTNVRVDVIRGRDRRRNQAKSWFWQKRKAASNKKQEEAEPPRETLDQFLEKNGNRGKVLESGGRISLAHEDAPGYAKALLEFLAD